jgi:valyl-tRNA synthetase
VTSAKQSDNSTKDIATVGNATIEYTNDFVDATQQKAKLIHELERLDNEIKRSQTILNNPQFVQKAPQVKIKAEREKLTKYQAQYNEISHQLKNK